MGDGGGTVRCTHLKIAGWKLIFCSRWVCLLKKYIYSILTIYLSLNLFNYVETSHIDLQYFAFEQELFPTQRKTSWKWTHGRWVADHLKTPKLINNLLLQKSPPTTNSTILHHHFRGWFCPLRCLFLCFLCFFLSFFLSFFLLFLCLFGWLINLFIYCLICFVLLSLKRFISLFNRYILNSMLQHEDTGKNVKQQWYIIYIST